MKDNEKREWRTISVENGRKGEPRIARTRRDKGKKMKDWKKEMDNE